MPKLHKPRSGSLQFWPRKKAKKLLPRIKWNSISKGNNLKGFIGYKVGMKTAYVKDNTPNSMTKNQRINIPVTIIECPALKILSIRFYKDGKTIHEVLNENLDKELKKRLKLPKQTNIKKTLEEIEKKQNFDDIKIITYTQVKKTSVKKTPDISEIGLAGSLSEKLDFVKNNLNKEISIRNVFSKGLVDVRGVTKGKGFQGPTKRFGLTLRAHKSEKGVRGPGSIGPWHPARIDFRIPRAGQMGFFTRANYNLNVLDINNINEKDINPKQGFKRYGKIKTDYIIVRGSILGPTKRQLLITTSLRPSKIQNKKDYEIIDIR